jgi:hypothetical protein
MPCVFLTCTSTHKNPLWTHLKSTKTFSVNTWLWTWYVYRITNNPLIQTDPHFKHLLM